MDILKCLFSGYIGSQNLELVCKTVIKIAEMLTNKGKETEKKES